MCPARLCASVCVFVFPFTAPARYCKHSDLLRVLQSVIKMFHQARSLI